MYHSNGNYEAFARPRKPKGVENKTAWFAGSGLAALAGARWKTTSSACATCTARFLRWR
jgi:myosin-crossreactive antigen